MLVQLMRTHPLIWLKGKILKNPLYTDPANVIADLGRWTDPTDPSG